MQNKNGRGRTTPILRGHVEPVITRQTSYISVAGDVADVDFNVNIDVADATSSSVPSSLFSCEISSESACVTT